MRGPSRGPRADDGVELGHHGEADLGHHGDAEVAPGLVDLAVNVRRRQPPAWLRLALLEALDDVAAYPDPRAATAAVARRHGVDETQVLVTAGGAEVFTLLARALPPDTTRAVVVHPQFTEPELALRTAGHRVTRVLLRPDDGFALDPSRVPDDATLVVVGNPTNPTSVLHRRDLLTALARPGRVLCVDEAFMDAVPGEPQTLAGPVDVPGLVVVRSLTKTWGIAGLRAGYVVGDAAVVVAMRRHQPPWSVGSLALAATVACCSARATRDAAAQAREGISQARLLATALRGLGEEHRHVRVPVDPVAPFVLLHVSDGEYRRQRLRERGWAVRGGASFPGLGPDWWRLAARDGSTTTRFVAEFGEVLTMPALAGPRTRRTT